MKTLWMMLVTMMAAAALISLPGCGKADDPNTLNLYIWAEYIPDSVLEKFTQRTGIKVNVDTYTSNELLLQKLQSGGTEYDICVPSDYMTKILREEKLIREINGAAMPGLANVNKRFLDRAFDPGNKFSVPYLWGTTGLGYNKQAVKTPVESWAAVFDPQYDGRILMLDDVRECFAVALRMMGQSINTRDPAVLRQAAEMLKKQKPLVKTFNSDDYDNILASGDVIIAHSYNGQIAKRAMKEPAKFAFVLPKEGGTVAQDNLVVPVNAPHPENAMKFIAFILEPEIAAEIVNGVNYASTNEAAKKFIRKDILENAAIYPSEAALAKCETMEDLGEATRLLDELWTEIKAR